MTKILVSCDGYSNTDMQWHFIIFNYYDVRITVSGDESVLSTFTISSSTVQPLVAAVCVVLGAQSVQDLAQRFTAQEVKERLLAAVEEVEPLSALAVVGWETNER